MQINVSELLNNPGNCESYSETWCAEDVALENNLYSLGESLEVSLLLYNAGGIIELEGSYGGLLEYHCNRCLEAITNSLNSTFEARFYRPSRDLSEVAEEIDRDNLYLRNYSEDERIDVGALIREDIVLNWPMQALCKPDCKGLCPVCGQNLNQADCGHEAESTDPRLSKLKDVDLPEENEVSEDN